VCVGGVGGVRVDGEEEVVDVAHVFWGGFEDWGEGDDL